MNRTTMSAVVLAVAAVLISAGWLAAPACLGAAPSGNDDAGVKSVQDRVTAAFSLPYGVPLSDKQKAEYERLKAEKESDVRAAAEALAAATDPAAKIQRSKELSQLRREIRVALRQIIMMPYAEALRARQQKMLEQAPSDTSGSTYNPYGYYPYGNYPFGAYAYGYDPTWGYPGAYPWRWGRHYYGGDDYGWCHNDRYRNGQRTERLPAAVSGNRVVQVHPVDQPAVKPRVAPPTHKQTLPARPAPSVHVASAGAATAAKPAQSRTSPAPAPRPATKPAAPRK